LGFWREKERIVVDVGTLGKQLMKLTIWEKIQSLIEKELRWQIRKLKSL
jgi:hypothetical protein